MRLDLFSLELFVDIVDLRSIAKGAAKNCIAVSAASKRVSDLEHALSAKLLHRQSRGVVTTEAGETLYRGVKETVSRLHQVAAAVREQAGGIKRPVRVYSNLTSLVHFLPGALKSFAAAQPAIPIELEEQPTAATLQAVSRGEADIGIVAPIAPYPANLVCFRYRVMRHVVVVPAGHPLSHLASTTFDQAAAHDFIGLENQGGWDQLLRKVAQERGCEFRVRVRVNSFDAMCHMIASGLGIAIVPAPTAEAYAVSSGVRILALDEPWAEIPLDICTRDPESLPHAVRLLLEHLRLHPADAEAPPQRVGSPLGLSAFASLAASADRAGTTTPFVDTKH